MAEPSVFKYRAFLSYAHADGRTARWLHKALETYPIDPAAVGRQTALSAVPKNLRPIFLDREDFAGGHSLTDATVAALDQSAALIVLCSKVSATRPAVAEEVRLFRLRHPERPVIPVVLDGAFPDNFPPPLRFEIAPDGTVTDRPVTILGPDLRKDADGRELALAKVVSGLTGLSTLDVFNRFKREQTRQARRRWAIAGVLLLSLGGFGYFFHDARQKGEVIAVRETERSQALDIARQLLGANPAAAAAPGQEQSLVAALSAIQEQAARGDGDYAKAFDLLKAGKGAEAVPLLIAAADAKKARAAKENTEAAKAYREAATVAGLGNPKLASELYGRALEIDPDDRESLYWHGWLHLLAGKLEVAERSLQSLLAKATEAKDQQGIFRALLRLGLVAHKRGNLNLAREMQNAASSIVAARVKSRPEDLEWQRDLSVLYIKVGNVQVAQGQLPDALITFRDSLAIAERLANADLGNAEWQRDLSVSYTKVGGVLLAQGRLPDALTAFRDSLAIAERLANADLGNAEWQRDLSVLNLHLGDVYQAQGDLAAALREYQASLNRMIPIRDRDPTNAELQRFTSVTITKIGDVLVAQGQLPDALKAFRDGLVIAERLAKADPGNAGWQRDLALSYGRVARIQAQSGEKEVARHGYGKARDIIARLVKLSPDNATLSKDLAYYDAQIAALD